MKSKQTMFFALDGDLCSILQEVEEKFQLEYIEMGNFETKKVVKFSSFSELPHFGYSKHGSWVGLDPSYLVRSEDSILNIEEFKLSKGGFRFLIDQLKNPASITLTIGGLYTQKEKVIVAGRVATVSDDPFSTAIYNFLSSKIKKNFNRIGVFYVGPKAEEKLKEGWRLVTDVKSPEEYDLTYQSE